MVKENQLDMWRCFLQSSRSVQAIQQGHSNVQDHDVWLERIGGFQQRTAIFNAAYHVVMGFQQFRESRADHRVIIGQQIEYVFVPSHPPRKLRRFRLPLFLYTSFLRPGALGPGFFRPD